MQLCLLADKKHRVVIVGAGIGGLSAAVVLASKGVPVTVIEQHNSVGGKARRVRVANKYIDVGPTVFTMRWVFEQLFADAGLSLDECINLRQNSVLARHSWVGSDHLDLHSSVERSAQCIEAMSGAKDAQAYRDFAKKSEDVFNTLNTSFMQSLRPSPVGLAFSNGIGGIGKMAQIQPFISLWKSLSKSFSDPRLIQLFARYATYCGSSPFQAPATLMLIAHVERAGVWVIDGGMQALAEALLSAAKSFGCEVHVGCSVEKIRTDTSGVVGVSLEDGVKLDASAVIFNGDVLALSNGSVGAACSNAARTVNAPALSAIARAEVAQSHGFNLAHHNVFFGDNYAAEFKAIFGKQTLHEDPTIYVCAQDRNDTQRVSDTNSDGTQLQCERLFSLMNAPAKDLSDCDIDNACNTMTARLQAHGLTLTGHQGTSHIDTPNSFAQLFPASKGALYGRPTHGWMGSFSRPSAQTNINGLYLAGGTVHPGAGVPMVSLSGQLAAKQLLKDRSGLRDL